MYLHILLNIYLRSYNNFPSQLITYLYMKYSKNIYFDGNVFVIIEWVVIQPHHTA